jgi:ribonuclease E
VDAQMQQQLDQQRTARQRLLQTLFAFRDDEMSDSEEVDDADEALNGDEEMIDLADDDDDDDDDIDMEIEDDHEDDIESHHSSSDQEVNED